MYHRIIWIVHRQVTFLRVTNARNKIQSKNRIVPSVRFLARSIPGLQPRFPHGPRHMQQLEELYKGRLTKNKLTKAERLAAKE